MTHQKISSTEGQTADNLGPGRLASRQPVAVIDIGSNSVRQVIYEGLTRAPSILFNEKVLCGLGKGVADTGRLDDTAVERAINAAHRFVALGKQADVAETYILATAAAREAENGPEFISAIEEIVGSKVLLLTGEMEAEYAALGVACGFHQPKGIAGDLGGGSLELMGIGEDFEEPITLPLGGLRLFDTSGGSLTKAAKIARQTLEEIPKVFHAKTKTFYAVGGTWRSLAKLHMVSCNYPLSVLHDYTISAKECIEFCETVTEGKLSDLDGINSISKNRQQLLPYGAIVMAETLKATGAKSVKISAFGVREGFLYSLLSDEEKTKDPLIEASRELDILRARSPGHAEEMIEWTGKAFETLDIEETDDEKRYRIAACYLADIAWRAHSDFRAEQSLGIISNAVFAGVSHEGRAYLALANYRRHVGLSAKAQAPAIVELCGSRVRDRARVLAGMFRVLYLFSASIKGMLPVVEFSKLDKKRFALQVPNELATLLGERPANRTNQLAKELGVEIELRVRP